MCGILEPCSNFTPLYPFRCAHLEDIGDSIKILFVALFLAFDKHISIEIFILKCYLFFLKILRVQLQGVELNWEGAGVSHSDFSFHLSAGRQTRPQLQNGRAELKLWRFTPALCCQENLLPAVSHMDHKLPAVSQLQRHKEVTVFGFIFWRSFPDNRNLFNNMQLCYALCKTQSMKRLTPSAGLNFIWTLTRSPGDSTPEQGVISNAAGGGRCCCKTFLRWWRGRNLSAW